MVPYIPKEIAIVMEHPSGEPNHPKDIPLMRGSNKAPKARTDKEEKLTIRTQEDISTQRALSLSTFPPAAPPHVHRSAGLSTRSVPANLPIEGVASSLQFQDNDVLSGRGAFSRLYLRIVRHNYATYQNASMTKVHKKLLVQSIVTAIENKGGRFLRLGRQNEWTRMMPRQAYRKTAQALREDPNNNSKKEQAEPPLHQQVLPPQQQQDQHKKKFNPTSASNVMLSASREALPGPSTIGFQTSTMQAYPAAGSSTATRPYQASATSTTSLSSTSSSESSDDGGEDQEDTKNSATFNSTTHDSNGDIAPGTRMEYSKMIPPFLAPSTVAKMTSIRTPHNKKFLATSSRFAQHGGPFFPPLQRTNTGISRMGSRSIAPATTKNRLEHVLPSLNFGQAAARGSSATGAATASSARNVAWPTPSANYAAHTSANVSANTSSNTTEFLPPSVEIGGHDGRPLSTNISSNNMPQSYDEFSGEHHRNRRDKQRHEEQDNRGLRANEHRIVSAIDFSFLHRTLSFESKKDIIDTFLLPSSTDTISTKEIVRKEGHDSPPEQCEEGSGRQDLAMMPDSSMIDSSEIFASWRDEGLLEPNSVFWQNELRQKVFLQANTNSIQQGQQDCGSHHRAPGAPLHGKVDEFTEEEQTYVIEDISMMEIPDNQHPLSLSFDVDTEINSDIFKEFVNNDMENSMDKQHLPS